VGKKHSHQAGSVMKHVSATTMDSTSGGGQDNCEDATQDVSKDVQLGRVSQSELSLASKKRKFQD
jgi:hypothetical protein